MQKTQIKSGDIFSFEISKAIVCIGQIVENDDGIISVVVFEGKYSFNELKGISLDITKLNPLASMVTFDVLFGNGMWAKLEESEVIAEVSSFPKKHIAPVRLINAMKAYYHYEGWKDHYQELFLNED